MTPLLTYHLTRPCGRATPFCRSCTNSFTIGSCAPTHCDVDPPSMICLTAKPGGDCTNCGKPVAIKLRDFVLPNFDAPNWDTSVFSGDYVLLPSDSISCDWYRTLPITYDEHPDRELPDCAWPIPCQLITTGTLRISLREFSPGEFTWHFICEMVRYTRATAAVPECDIEEGQDLPGINSYEYRGVDVVQSPKANCVTPFTMDQFHGGIEPPSGLLTLEFLEIQS